MKKKKIRIPPNATCLDCLNCIPIGEGDHVCNECGEPVIVIEDYSPSSDYLKCGGRHYEA